LALGVASISLKDLLFSYATLLNQGVRVEPYYLISISNNVGDELDEFPSPPTEQTDLNAVNCQIVTHMMQSVINDGTGKNIRSVYNIQGDFAGKTGTTQNQSDGWFVGMNPDLIAGCWVGAEDPGIHFKTIIYGQGAYMALPIVGKFYNKLYSDSRYRKMQYIDFPHLDSELLADLNIPSYRETFEINKQDNIIERLFAGKSKEKKLKEIREPSKEPKRKKLWESIKDIFKKKK
jgi:penicillin-binding protein 1A